MSTSRQPATGLGPEDETEVARASLGHADDALDPAPQTDLASSPAPSAEPWPVQAEVDTGPILGPAASEPLAEFEPMPPERPVTRAARRTGKVRKARLRLLRVEPWSVMKSAFVLSIAIGITFVVAAATLWSVVDAAGVFEVVGSLITELTESQTSAGLEITDYVGFSRVVGLATVIAVVDVVLLTALATLFAFLYNLSAALLGGFEVTLAEDD